MRTRVSDAYGSVLYCNPYDFNAIERDVAFERVQNYNRGIGDFADELADMRQAESVYHPPTSRAPAITPSFIEDAILQQTIVKERDMSLIGEAKLKLAQQILGRNGTMVEAEIRPQVRLEREPIPRREIIQQRREQVYEPTFSDEPDFALQGASTSEGEYENVSVSSAPGSSYDNRTERMRRSLRLASRSHKPYD